MSLPLRAADPPRDTRLPSGTQVRLDDGVVVGDHGRALIGGDPVRVAYLSVSARELLRDGRGLRVAGDRSAALARRLVDGGLAHPVGGPAPCATDVTVVVPVRDRPLALARLLAALPPGLAVIVVDDGSVDPEATAVVTRRHRVRLVAHPAPLGPSAARNTGLRQVSTGLVAFVDSDCVPEPGWLDLLLGQLVDPAVGAVAPRVVALPGGRFGGSGWLGRYEQTRSSLDLGPRPARVLGRGRVAYVPSACLLGRVEALGTGFDESLPVAEDVDLVWRLDAAGWRVRYCPAARVGHEHRVVLRAWLARKAYYGTGAAPLAARHGRLVAPVAMPWWAAVGCAALLAQRVWSLPVATAGAALATAGVSRRLHASEHPVRTASRLVAAGAGGALGQAGAALTRHWWPLAAVGAMRSRRARRAVAVAAVAGALADWRRDRSELDPMRYLIARRLDDLAYGGGVWWGALRAGRPDALLPDLSGHQPRP